jgi:hypothetical protein
VKGLKIDPFGFLTRPWPSGESQIQKGLFSDPSPIHNPSDHTKQVNILLGVVGVGWELGRCQQSSEKSLSECFLFPKFQEFKATEKWKQGGGEGWEDASRLSLMNKRERIKK